MPENSIPFPRFPLSFFKSIEDAHRQLGETAKQMTPLLEGIRTAVEAHERAARVALPTFESILRFANPIILPTRTIENAEPLASRATIPAYAPAVSGLDSEIDLLVTHVEERAASPVSLPEGTKWHELVIRFKDAHTLRVYRGKKHLGDYYHADLGFARRNTRDGKPDKQWELLQRLSIASIGKTKFRPTADNLAYDLHCTRGACHQAKRKLSKILCLAFGLTEDPFLTYNAETGYKTRFTLEPEALLRGRGELRPSGGHLIDEITPDPDNDEY